MGKRISDVAAIVETIAMKKAKEQSDSINEKLKEIDELNAKTAKEKAEVQLLQIHPDFSEIRESDDFHEWAEEQPKWCKTHYTKIAKMQGQQLEQLTFTSQTEALARQTRARVARVLLRKLKRKIQELFLMPRISLIKY